MTKRELAQIALKILGIYALLHSIQLIGGFINAIGFPIDEPFYRPIMLLSMIVPFVILVWAGLFLLKKNRINKLKILSGWPN